MPASNHVLTTGLTFYRDRSSDTRTTSTTMSLVGQVALGQRGPAPVVLPAPVPLGPPTIAHPVRVPDASLRDVAIFAQDEWRLMPNLSLVAGLRGDFYNVTTEATPGYDVASVVAGANPPVDPSTLPDPNGATYTRQGAHRRHRPRRQRRRHASARSSATAAAIVIPTSRSCSSPGRRRPAASRRT